MQGLTTNIIKRLSIIILLVFFGGQVFAQDSSKDSIVYNLPMVNGKLIYADSVKVKDHSKTKLDSTAKNWLNSYFKYHTPDTSAIGKDTVSSVLSLAVLEYNIKPGLISIPFYAVITICITCENNAYSYKIYNIHFRPKKGMLNSIGYQNDPEYLIKLYKQKHIGFVTSMNVDRRMIRNYLFNTNKAVNECIVCLKEAMAN